MGFKPMLASVADFEKVRYPIMGSPKYDGIRATVFDGRLISRTLKEIPNRFVYGILSQPQFEGLDGELIVGGPTAKDCYRTTVSGVMSRDGEPVFSFHVFDVVKGGPWSERIFSPHIAKASEYSPTITLVKHEILTSYQDVCDYEEEQLSRGHEGIMLRDPMGYYKFGRSTSIEALLLKVKRFEDSEAEIIDMEEEMENQNELTRDERGYAKRTSHQANKVGKGTMGALIVRDVNSGVLSRIGTGFDYRTRMDFWKNRESYIGKVVKYKYFPVGVKDKPRHPVFLGMRPEGA